MESTHLHATFTVAVPMAIMCTMLRYALSVCTRASGKKSIKGNNSKSSATRDAIVEECWLLMSSCFLFVLSMWATMRHNGGCMIFAATDYCFESWPAQTQSIEMKSAIAVYLGWYAHCLLKNLVPAIGGQHAGSDMVGHHIVTLGLLLVQHAFHVQRAGLLILALLSVSSPFMHAAKIAHHIGGMPQLKAGLFILFTMVFGASRCIEFPRMLISMAMLAARRSSEGTKGIAVPAAVCFAGLGALQLLQFVWLWKMIKIIARGGMESKSQTSVQKDADTLQKLPSEPAAAAPNSSHSDSLRNTTRSVSHSKPQNVLDAPAPAAAPTPQDQTTLDQLSQQHVHHENDLQGGSRAQQAPAVLLAEPNDRTAVIEKLGEGGGDVRRRARPHMPPPSGVASVTLDAMLASEHSQHGARQSSEAVRNSVDRLLAGGSALASEEGAAYAARGDGVAASAATR